MQAAQRLSKHAAAVLSCAKQLATKPDRSQIWLIGVGQARIPREVPGGRRGCPGSPGVARRACSLPAWFPAACPPAPSGPPAHISGGLGVVGGGGGGVVTAAGRPQHAAVLAMGERLPGARPRRTRALPLMTCKDSPTATNVRQNCGDRRVC